MLLSQCHNVMVMNHSCESWSESLNHTCESWSWAWIVDFNIDLKLCWVIKTLQLEYDIFTVMTTRPRVWHRCRSHHGIMVTGDTGMGVVSKIQTWGHTMTHHYSVMGFWWVTSLSYFPEFFHIFKLNFSFK